MSYQLLALDLDGTILDKTMVLDPRLCDSVRRAAARGLHVTLATGRMPPGSRRYWEELGITAPVILYNAVGDQENDLEMIRAAGVGVAMPHAPERVRAVADRIAPAPEAGGLLALFAELSPEHFA